MAQWMNVLDISQAWHKADKREICIQELAKIIAEELEKIDALDDYLNAEKNEIADCFTDLSEDEEAGDVDFNYIMSDLYDWADTPLDNKVFNGKKLCWVKTYF